MILFGKDHTVALYVWYCGDSVAVTCIVIVVKRAEPLAVKTDCGCTRRFSAVPLERLEFQNA